jgi:hypothetical protein
LRVADAGRGAEVVQEARGPERSGERQHRQHDGAVVLQLMGQNEGRGFVALQ